MSTDEEEATEDSSLVQRAPILLNDTRNEPVAKALGICYILWFVLALAPCIVALLFASEYSNFRSSLVCNVNNRNYTVGLDTWLFVASILSILVSVTYIILNSYQTFFASLSMYRKISQSLLSPIHALIQFVITLFHTIWAIIGLIIYTQQMSPQCQQTDVALMILIFAVLELLNTSCVGCCFCAIIGNRDRTTFGKPWIMSKSDEGHHRIDSE